MAQRQVAALGTAAVTDGSQAGAFMLLPSHFKHGLPLISIAGLAGSETASLYVRAGDSWEIATNSAGEALVFTATSSTATITAPGTFAFIKDSSAGALSVFLNHG